VRLQFWAIVAHIKDVARTSRRGRRGGIKRFIMKYDIPFLRVII